MSKNKRILSSFIVASACAVLTVSSTSQAAEAVPAVKLAEEAGQGMAVAAVLKEAKGKPQTIVEKAREKKAAEEQAAREEAERQRAAEEAARQQAAAEEAARQRAAAEEAARRQAAAEEAAREQAAEVGSEIRASQSDATLLAAIIYCEAGNQSYEGQVAVGAVVMNRVKSGSYPNSISEVIYQSGQFGPAMTGWLDQVLSSGSYTDTAVQAAQDALAGNSPVGNCLYFDRGGSGMQIGDHYFH